MDEAELVQRSKQGDLGSFNILVENYQRLVYNLALRMLDNVPAAEDATQDTFVSAWRGIGGFRGSNFKTWLLRIAAHHCHDQLRWAKRHPTLSLEEPSLKLQELPSPRSPEEYALSQELGEEIERGLASLPSEQRLAVLLSDVYELSYEEMTRIMGCSLGTVKSRLSRGRVRLRDYLRQKGTFSR